MSASKNPSKEISQEQVSDLFNYLQMFKLFMQEREFPKHALYKARAINISLEELNKEAEPKESFNHLIVKAMEFFQPEAKTKWLSSEKEIIFPFGGSIRSVFDAFFEEFAGKKKEQIDKGFVLLSDDNSSIVALEEAPKEKSSNNIESKEDEPIILEKQERKAIKELDQVEGSGFDFFATTMLMLENIRIPTEMKFDLVKSAYVHFKGRNVADFYYYIYMNHPQLCDEFKEIFATAAKSHQIGSNERLVLDYVAAESALKSNGSSFYHMMQVKEISGATKLALGKTLELYEQAWKSCSYKQTNFTSVIFDVVCKRLYLSMVCNDVVGNDKKFRKITFEALKSYASLIFDPSGDISNASQFFISFESIFDPSLKQKNNHQGGARYVVSSSGSFIPVPNYLHYDPSVQALIFQDANKDKNQLIALLAKKLDMDGGFDVRNICDQFLNPRQKAFEKCFLALDNDFEKLLFASIVTMSRHSSLNLDYSTEIKNFLAQKSKIFATLQNKVLELSYNRTDKEIMEVQMHLECVDSLPDEMRGGVEIEKLQTRLKLVVQNKKLFDENEKKFNTSLAKINKISSNTKEFSALLASDIYDILKDLSDSIVVLKAIDRDYEISEGVRASIKNFIMGAFLPYVVKYKPYFTLVEFRELANNFMVVSESENDAFIISSISVQVSNEFEKLLSASNGQIPLIANNKAAYITLISCSILENLKREGLQVSYPQFFNSANNQESLKNAFNGLLNIVKVLACNHFENVQITDQGVIVSAYQGINNVITERGIIAKKAITIQDPNTPFNHNGSTIDLQMLEQRSLPEINNNNINGATTNLINTTSSTTPNFLLSQRSSLGETQEIPNPNQGGELLSIEDKTEKTKKNKIADLDPFALVIEGNDSSKKKNPLSQPLKLMDDFALLEAPIRDNEEVEEGSKKLLEQLEYSAVGLKNSHSNINNNNNNNEVDDNNVSDGSNLGNLNLSSQDAMTETGQSMYVDPLTVKQTNSPVPTSNVQKEEHPIMAILKAFAKQQK